MHATITGQSELGEDPRLMPTYDSHCGAEDQHSAICQRCDAEHDCVTCLLVASHPAI
jgi:hypothetical protein